MRLRKTDRSVRSIVCTAIVALMATVPASAQLIQQGIDIFRTVPGGGTFVNVDLPADFFCPGSAPVFAPVNLQGMPLATNPPGILGTADTVVERLKDARLGPGECAEVPITVRALKLTSSNPLSVICPATGDETRWAVDACTCGCCGPQPITKIKICVDDSTCGCGTFTGDLTVNVCLKFRNLEDGTILGPVQQQINLSVNTPWCANNPGSVLEAKDVSMVDTNCDGMADLAVPCTTNFFPGATCGGPSCPPDVCHEGPDHPHCVNPVCGKHDAVVELPGDDLFGR